MIPWLLFACEGGGGIKIEDTDSGVVLDDPDGDGWAGAADCDETNAAVHPTAIEVCNGIDDDCDTLVDEGVSSEAWADNDGDGFGAGEMVRTCAATAGYVANNLDCDDTSAEIRPGAEEGCDGLDNDCDGVVDPDNGTWYRDGDGDGFGDDTTGRESCDHDLDEVADGGDCDDGDALVNPGADDLCGDGLDTNCDGRDTSCMLGGEYDMGSASAKVYASSGASYAGEYIDAGDINGDGFGDVVVGTMYADGYDGGAYVVYGPVEGELTLDDAGDHLIGSRATYLAGRSIATADVNGDGYDDVAIGAADETCKEWIFYGPLGGDVNIVDADATRTGLANTELGHGSDLGDVNGDGFADLIVGAYENDRGGYDAGIVFIEFGPIADGSQDMDTVAGLELVGESGGAYAGRYVHGGEDVDGDGIGDILVGAPYASGGAPSGGGAYLVYGGITGELDLADADAKYVGEHASEYAAEGLTMGDVSGDGLADVVLGSMSNVGGAGSGAVYIVYGPATSVVGLDDSDVVMRGDTAGALFGIGLDVADADGDGVGDLSVGAMYRQGGGLSSGAGYFFFGPMSSGDDPTNADAIFWGESRSDGMGMSAAISDINGDGLGDVVFGAPGDATGGNAAGAIFLQLAVGAGG